MVSLSGAIEAPHYPPGAIDYDMFLRATRMITRHEGDVEQAFHRMVFNVLAGNRDDHTRQHAFLMNDEGDWRLAPAFDLTFSAGPGGEHCMAILGEGRHPTRRHVDQLGAEHGISKARIAGIVDQVTAAVDRWPKVAGDAEVGAASAREIAGRLANIRGRF
jgi:serine/threonine-protein kinase HipA